MNKPSKLRCWKADSGGEYQEAEGIEENSVASTEAGKENRQYEAFSTV